MKKIMFLMAVLTFILTVGIGTAHAQQVGIDAAIQSVAEGLSSSIGSGTGVAVLSMQADSARMSDYLIDEMITTLMGLQGGRGFTTMSRARFDQLMGGLQTGPVDDAAIQAVGRVLGVRYIVTGTFEPLADFFRFRVQLIEAETAAVRSIQTADVQNDSLLAYLMGGARPVQVATPRVVTELIHAPARVDQFTINQRWGTWFLNGILPGVGSFTIMNDTFGGWFQIICAGLGFTMMIAANTVLAERVYWGGTVIARYTNSTAWVFGWLLFSTWQVYNIIRSATFGRNVPVAVTAMPATWDIALTPGKNGIEGFTLSHTRRF